MSNALSFEDHDDTAIVRFTRAASRNPLSVEVLDELDRVIDLIDDDRSVKRVYFTGTADVFASGADIREIAQVTPEKARAFATRGQHLMNRIAELRTTTIAAVNGYCYGGALDLTLACDRRVASPNATFCHPGVGLGIITGWGGTQRLPRLVGETNALRMFLSAEPIDADEALRIGLIDAINNELQV
jgi:enoyl-CoA hydratase